MPQQPALPPGSRTTTVQLHRNFSLNTLATMLGPSPDWFVGVTGLSLWDGGTRDGVIPQTGGPEMVGSPFVAGRRPLR